ncbi:heme-binding protein, partial [Escherichia coli]|uniref:heme-binding protein n=1 Tax=Escherichia coli TaxID=562 RepID=UPI002118B6D3
MLTTKTTMTIEAAKAVASACEAAAKADGLKLVIAIVDDGGHLVLLHRDDGAQVGSVEIAILK